jgi:hypothetical protein
VGLIIRGRDDETDGGDILISYQWERRAIFKKERRDKMKKYLSTEEMAFLKKLCQPESFMPTFPERVMLEVFLKEGIAKRHRDGSIEVTNRGANCYAATIA